MEGSSLHSGLLNFRLTEEETGAEKLRHLLKVAQQLIGLNWLSNALGSARPHRLFSQPLDSRPVMANL